MKRVGNLFEKLVDIENIKLADKRARQHKSKSLGVRLHDKNKEVNLLKLQRMLIEGTYVTSPYQIFTLYGHKERRVYRLPYYPDRIVHHALMNILEDIWISVFIKNTFSCIKGRGVHAAIKALQKDLSHSKEGTKYCLKLDISKFYPSVDHEILKKILRRKIKDKRVLQLLDSIIESAPGIPIGNYLSQFFANLYLAYFDHWIKEDIGIRYYYRYADDIVVLHHDKQFLYSLLIKIEEYLRDNLKLAIVKSVNGKIIYKYQIFPVEKRGIDFLGYVLRHDYILLRKSIKQHLCKKVSKLNRRNLEPKTYKHLICGWWGWCNHCNSRHLLKTIIKSDIYGIIQYPRAQTSRAYSPGGIQG